MRIPLRVLIVGDLPEQAEIVAHELTNAGFALAWSILCLLLHGREVHSHRELLARRYSDSGFLDETRTMALALLALSGRVEALRV